MGIKRWIIFVHRYLGIPMSVVFVVWFLSGLVMIYARDMPALGEQERLAGLGTLALDSVRLSPAAAAARAGLDGPVTAASLTTLLGRPAYRFGRSFGASATVFADTGEIFEGATREDGRREVARFFAVDPDRVAFAATVAEADQWTLIAARELPLERYDVDDGHATRAYFSLRRGEVALATNRSSRTLAWLGAIPHWFYFTPLRRNQPLWYWSVVWIAVAGTALAALGLVLAVTQFRRSRPFRLSTSIRYRGLMRWHYYTGAVFGAFALTWVFSGLLSMEPFAWTNARGMDLPPNDLEGGALDLERYRPDDPSLRAALGNAPPAEIELMRIQQHPYYLVRSADPEGSAARRLVDADTLDTRTEPFSPESILTVLRATVTDVGIADATVLDDYDAYYYAQDGSAPVPVLRVKFDDPARTWYYFDLETSSAVAANHRLSRLERWLFNGLHGLDFPFWYRRRPLWDIGVIALCLGALATSGIGLYLGSKRLLGRASPSSSARRNL